MLLALLMLSACVSSQGKGSHDKPLSAKGDNAQGDKKSGEQNGRVVYPVSERACLERAIFFEANRSSREGLIAVGTVVMNRVHSSHYPNTICGVVGQAKQFAPGVLTRKINIEALPDIREAADAVLRGERHPKLKNAMFFHTAGLKFPYTNMHYTLVAGGNAFYEKRRKDGSLHVAVNDAPYDIALAFAQEGRTPPPSSADPADALSMRVVDADGAVKGDDKGDKTDIDNVITAALWPSLMKTQEQNDRSAVDGLAASMPVSLLKEPADIVQREP